MDLINSCRRSSWHRWLGAAIFSLVVLCGVGWFAAIAGHPVDDAVVFGMTAPECEAVGDDRAGSLLTSKQPDSDVCRSYFIYHTAFADAADDPYTYRIWVMRQRVHSFWLIFPYLIIVWASAAGFAACARLTISFSVRRAAHRASFQRLLKKRRRLRGTRSNGDSPPLQVVDRPDGLRYTRLTEGGHATSADHRFRSPLPFCWGRY